MISKCDLSFELYLSRYGMRDICENPGRQDNIESILPLRNDNVDFRNIFCAYCNGVDLIKSSYWRMNIHCYDIITDTGDALLSTIRNKRCNIFYKPPWFQTAMPCIIPKYTIDKCNMTGVWPAYNDTIKQACESFVDPFNSTYRNYFCYLCNSPETIPRDSWYCPTQTNHVTISTPVYTTILDFDLFTKQRNKEIGCDLQTQFQDYKLVRRIYFFVSFTASSFGTGYILPLLSVYIVCLSARYNIISRLKR